MRFLLLLPLIYVAAVVETSLADVGRIGAVRPDLLAMLAMIWLLLVPSARSFLMAGLIGLASDLLAPGRLGLGVACFLLVGYAVTRVRRRLAWDRLLWHVAVVWVAVTVLAAGLAMGDRLWGETDLPVATLLLRSLEVGLYTAGVSLPILMVAGWIGEPFRTPVRVMTDVS